MPTSKYFLFPAALRKGPTISKPHCAKGQGLERGFKTLLVGVYSAQIFDIDRISLHTLMLPSAYLATNSRNGPMS